MARKKLSKKSGKTPEQFAAEYRQRKSKQYQQEHKERAARTRAYKKTHVPQPYPSLYRPVSIRVDPDFITNDDIAAALGR